MKDGRYNSSDKFEYLVEQVARTIKYSAADLLSGRVDVVAGVIMAQLAHVHGMVPKD